MLEKGFVYIDEVIPGLLWDARYFGSNNFMGRPADGYRANRVVCTYEAALALKIASEMTELRFMVFDAYRPARAVRDFVRWCNSPEDYIRKPMQYPNVDKSRMLELGYIAERSGHSRGSSIDLTLCHPDGTQLDMGTVFDYMDEKAHHDSCLVTEEQTENRELLRSLMLSAGFGDYKNEWWHYNLKNEPYPDTYFDFEIE